MLCQKEYWSRHVLLCCVWEKRPTRRLYKAVCLPVITGTNKSDNTILPVISPLSDFFSFLLPCIFVLQFPKKVTTDSILRPWRKGFLSFRYLDLFWMSIAIQHWPSCLFRWDRNCEKLWKATSFLPAVLSTAYFQQAYTTTQNEARTLWCTLRIVVPYRRFVTTCRSHLVGRDSVVSIATGCGLNGRGIGSRWEARFSAPV